MIYIKNKKIVDELGKATDPPVIDCENAPEIEFQLLDAAGEAVAPEAGVVYTFTGAVSFYGKGVIFGDEITAQAGDETLIFKPNTYNSDYIANVTVESQSVFVQIHKGGDGGGIVMFSKAIAKPRIADPAQPPAPIASYYTKTETDELLADLTAADITTEARGEPETQEAFNGYMYAAIESVAIDNATLEDRLNG